VARSSVEEQASDKVGSEFPKHDTVLRETSMSDQPDMMNRRTLLTRAAVLAVCGVTAATAQEKPKTEAQPARSTTPAASPNLRPPVVEVKGGKLRGFMDGKIFTFLGVPYAQAKRFELPKPVQPWQGIKNAQTWGPICPSPQVTTVSANGFVWPRRYWVENEDCQVLNIWTQNLGSVKKPVMVWMHGGGFTNGSSIEGYAYDGKALSEFGDVVAVTLNHRLNIIGTLDLSAYGPEYTLSRQTGMADLVAALQWIHDNIEAFGGDPGNVTIFGQSGGGGKVTRLMHMPAAKGLFHKVVSQSGGNLNYRNTDVAQSIKDQQAIAAETLKNLGFGNDINKLKNVPYHALIEAGTTATQALTKQFGRNFGWNPIADDQYVMREFTDWAETIPYMAGSVFGEFNVFRGQLSWEGKNEWTEKEINDLLTKVYGAKKDAVIAEFKKVYPTKKVQDAAFIDTTFRSGAKASVARKLEKTKAPVYSYLFDFEYPVNGGVPAFHGGEIGFIFHALSEPHMRLATGGGPAALALQDKMSQAWINFARTGNPSQPGLAWKPCTAADPQTMVFDEVSGCRAIHDDALLSMLPRGSGI
jgi:para-nitrobenzyl esterase